MGGNISRYCPMRIIITLVLLLNVWWIILAMKTLNGRKKSLHGKKVKRDVFQAMQIAQSGATQGLKSVFLCEFKIFALMIRVIKSHLFLNFNGLQ
jgi:hypothetical protein